MSEEKLSKDSAWAIAAEVTRMAHAYVCQDAGLVSHLDPALEGTLRNISESLSKHHESWEKRMSPLFPVSAVNGLTEIYDDFMNDRLNIEEARRASWQIFTFRDDPDFDNEELIRGFHLPSRSEISEHGGPKEAAIYFAEGQLGISRSSIYGYQRKIRRDGLGFKMPSTYRSYCKPVEFLTEVLIEVVGIQAYDIEAVMEALRIAHKRCFAKNNTVGVAAKQVGDGSADARQSV